MTGHYDAALFGAIMLFAFLFLLLYVARAHRKQVARVRIQRDKLRGERDNLHEQLLTLRGETVRAARRAVGCGPVRTPLTEVYLNSTVADMPSPYAPRFYDGGVR